jgi:ribosomal protein S12
MTSKEKAELLFKQEPLSGSRSSTPEYEQRAHVERTKTAMLRALRLARDAELASSPEERGVVTEKLTKPKSPKTSRRHAGTRERAQFRS